MKTKLFNALTAVILFLMPIVNFGQAPNLGSVSSFALFTAAGAVSNTGTTEIWGNVGTFVGAYSGSPTVYGQVHVADPAAAQAALAVDSVYSYLSGVTCDSVIGPILGNGQVLTPRVYCLGGASSINGTLILNGQGNPNAIFIFKINGALSGTAYSQVVLENSASLCNVYWQVNGLFSLATYSVFKGTVVADGAIALGAGVSLSGRGLSTAGAISLYNNIVAIGIQPTATITSGGNTTLCSGGSVTLNANVTNGVGPFSYSWSPGGGTNSSITVSPLTTTTYTVDVTAMNGCSSGIDTIVIKVSTPLIITATSTNVSCYGGNNGSGSVTVNGGITPYTYLWSNGGTTVVSTSNPTGAILSAGTYTITATDANGCNTTASISITQPVRYIYISAGTISNVTCNGLSNGNATVTTVGGTIPFTYSWVNASHTTVSTTQTTLDILSAGTYTVTVQDNCGVSKTATVNITQPNPLRDSIKSITGVGCNGGDGGTATVGGKGGTYPYSFLWSSGSTLVMATGLSAGTYSVVVTDQKGCTNTVGLTITQPGAIRDSVVNITYPLCNGGKGSVTVGVKGGTSPYIYTWTGGVSTTATATNLPAGSYTVSIKDSHSCIAPTITFTITQPLAIRDTIVPADKINVSCYGGSNGSAMIGVKYGTSPYTYIWSPNVSSTAIATGLTAGVYSVTITDKNGCSSSTVKVIITQPGALRDSLSTITCSNNLVKATVGVKGGTSPYIYLWSPGGGTKATMSSLIPGTYTITVTDKNHCSNTIMPDLTCPPGESPKTATGSISGCCPGLDGISLYPNPNTGQFTLTGFQQGMMVEIYDYRGRKVSFISISDITMQINISDQPNGIYLIRILSKDGNLVSQKKMVKTQ